MLKRYLKNQRGLTLIELLAVIVILGIIAAIAVPSIGGVISNTKTKVHQANALMILDAAKLFYLDHPGVTRDLRVNGTGTLSDTGTVPTALDIESQLVTNGKYLDEIPKNPITGQKYSTVTIAYHDGNYQITLGPSAPGGSTNIFSTATKSEINNWDFNTMPWPTATSTPANGTPANGTTTN